MWMRLRPAPGGGVTSLRSTPVVLLPRRNAALWSRLAPAPAEDAGLGSRAQRAKAYLAEHGASFFEDVREGTRLLKTELEEALAELVVRGRAHCDTFAGLRALMVPASKRAAGPARHRRRPLFGIEDAGRWTLMRPRESGATIATDDIEQAARTVLRRYGVIAWRLLEREAAWLPPWRDLVRACRRLEARGELRGGRFIAGLSGEQFALPEAVALMREVRRRAPDGAWVCLAATDPANLLGTVLPGPRLARVAGSRVLYRDGVPVATSVGGQVTMLVTLSAADTQVASRALVLDPDARAGVAGTPVMQPG